MPCKVILVGGASASGKTALAFDLKRHVEEHGKRAKVITLDDFYKDRNGESPPSKTYDEPDAFDFEAFTNLITNLIQGKTVNKPIFSHQEKRRQPNPEIINPENYDVIIIEGILTLYDLNTRLGDLVNQVITVYVESKDYETLLHNRIVRDALGQWQDPPSVTKYRDENAGVRAGFFSYIEPSKVNATFKITNNFYAPIQESELLNLEDLYAEKIVMAKTKTWCASRGLSWHFEKILTQIIQDISDFCANFKDRIKAISFAANPNYTALVDKINSELGINYNSKIPSAA